LSLLDPLRTAGRAHEAAIAGGGPDPFTIPVDEVHSATEATIAGRRTVMAGTNNYLGLTVHPECVQAAKTALDRWGTGTTGSRMANGSYAHHLDLEAQLADFFELPSAVVFSTGYQANLGMLTTLLDRGDAVLLDSDSHASIYDGASMSGADVYRFRHNDPESLDRRLSRLGDRATRTLVVTEGIFSALGDRAALDEIGEVARGHGAFLLVDEAHAVGVLGERGRGRTEEAGAEADVDFIVGTFSKSLGAMGGFCVSRHPEVEMVRFASRPYIFTASLPPSIVASTSQALTVVRERPELRRRLWDNARCMYDTLVGLGYRLGPDVSPVIAVHLSDATEGMACWRRLLERGVYVNLMLPPSTPSSHPLLRLSVTAAHTPEQIRRIGRAFHGLRTP